MRINVNTNLSAGQRAGLLVGGYILCGCLTFGYLNAQEIRQYCRDTPCVAVSASGHYDPAFPFVAGIVWPLYWSLKLSTDLFL